jgi:outer membrane receptor for Fe3+-dicitrate
VQIGKFSVTPAFRYEDIDYERRNNLAVGGCVRVPCVGMETVEAFIPGISVGFDPGKRISFFAGIHQGFAPPRVEDSIANDGGSIDINPEESVNLEVGFRSELVHGLAITRPISATTSAISSPSARSPAATIRWPKAKPCSRASRFTCAPTPAAC